MDLLANAGALRRVDAGSRSARPRTRASGASNCPRDAGRLTTRRHPGPDRPPPVANGKVLDRRPSVGHHRRALNVEELPVFFCGSPRPAPNVSKVSRSAR